MRGDALLAGASQALVEPGEPSSADDDCSAPWCSIIFIELCSSYQLAVVAECWARCIGQSIADHHDHRDGKLAVFVDRLCCWHWCMTCGSLRGGLVMFLLIFRPWKKNSKEMWLKNSGKFENIKGGTLWIVRLFRKFFSRVSFNVLPLKKKQ